MTIFNTENIKFAFTFLFNKFSQITDWGKTNKKLILMNMLIQTEEL